jgi:hypothetical protein
MQLVGKFLGVKAFWQTVDTGKLPPVDIILAELEEMSKAAPQQQQAMLQTQMQEQQADKQASLEKIALQNQSMEKQVAMSAMAKAGVRR